MARIRNAVFAAAYGETGALEKLSESPDDNTRNITNGLLEAAPHFARLHAAIASGDAQDRTIAPEIGAAADKLSELRAAGMTVDNYLRQTSLFEPDLDPLAKTLLSFYDEHKRSAKRIGEVLRAYIPPRWKGTVVQNKVRCSGQAAHTIERGDSRRCDPRIEGR